MAVWTVGFLQEDTRPCTFLSTSLVFGESSPLTLVFVHIYLSSTEDGQKTCLCRSVIGNKNCCNDMDFAAHVKIFIFKKVVNGYQQCTESKGLVNRPLRFSIARNKFSLRNKPQIERKQKELPPG